MLKLSDIKKDYKIASGQVHALKGVSLEFRRSEFVCILGQSGCGKTTLLNIIGGLDHYTSGDLVIQGKSTKDFKDRDWDVYRNHRIGFIFQSYNLIPHQTVLGNVELALTIAGLGRDERRARAKEALERVGLGEELNKKPNQLSGGQMQRVAIARALVNNPDILLADEPTGALDSKTSVEVMDLIRDISGERLVIMVTHNPELAEEYATRIVRLHDGLVEADSNPYSAAEDTGTEPAPKAASGEAAEETEAAPEATKKRREKKPRAKMGLFTSLALSARNLLTKKGRTIITSVAGSIGIISVCLVLALSSGFSNYIKKTEEDMLSYYPVQIQENTYDISSMMASFTSPKDMPDLEQIGDSVYIDSFLTNLAKGMAVTNNISDDYLEYLGGMDESWYSAIQYGYGVQFANNLFTKVDTMDVNGSVVNLTPTVRSLANLKQHYIDVLETQAEQYRQLTGFARFFGNIVHKMPGTEQVGSEKYAEYVLTQYDVLGGSDAHFPQNENEVALVIGTNNEVTDLTLAQLGFLNEFRFLSLFELGRDNDSSMNSDGLKVAFSDIIGKEYTLFYNNAVFTENEDYKLPAFDDPNAKADYPFNYQGQRQTLTAGKDAEGNDEGINLKISCVLRLKDGLTYGCLKPGLNLTEETVMHYIRTNMKSDIVKWMNEKGRISDGLRIYALSPSAQLDSYYTALGAALGDKAENLPKGLEGLRISTDSTQALRALGGSDVVSTVSIYATDFDGKDKVLAYLDAWNEMEGREEGDKVTYTDTVGLLMGMVQTMLDVITYVLVAFTAISLVVSSVMIGIITYVSVVERVKEIGVLRSLGARKRDIKNLFNAETFIIGLGAGLIGIFVTYLLSLVINLAISTFTGISGIAALPPLTAFIMVCVSVLLTLISGLIPAAAAAKKDPVIALRTE